MEPSSNLIGGTEDRPLIGLAWLGLAAGVCYRLPRGWLELSYRVSRVTSFDRIETSAAGPLVPPSKPLSLCRLYCPFKLKRQMRT